MHLNWEREENSIQMISICNLLTCSRETFTHCNFKLLDLLHVLGGRLHQLLCVSTRAKMLMLEDVWPLLSQQIIGDFYMLCALVNPLCNVVLSKMSCYSGS